MDKQTLSHYGWIVVLTLILAVMLAFATPFGKFIYNAVFNVTQSLVDVNDKVIGTIKPGEVCYHGNKETTPGFPANCTSSGLTDKVTCLDCGKDIIAAKVINPLGHDYGEAIIESEATCVANGSKRQECQRDGCEAVSIIPIPATGHTKVTDPAVAPTCTKTGLTTGTHCSVCNEVLSEQKTVAELGHNVVSDPAVAATCVSDGKTAGTHCSRCNTVIKAQTKIDALGHDLGDPVIIESPSCVDGGTTKRSCRRTGCTYFEIDTGSASGHTEVIDPAVEPTCETAGKTAGKHCSKCNEVLIAQTAVPALGHDDKVHNQKEPTCSEEGYTGDTICERCNRKITGSTIPATGHYDNNDDDRCDDCGREIIPEGGEYIDGNGTPDNTDDDTVLGSDDVFPENPQSGDEYRYGDYVYKYNYVANTYTTSDITKFPAGQVDETLDGWSVIAKNKDQETYSEILPSIANKYIKNMNYCYYYCDNSNAKTFPNIPQTIESMNHAFAHCGYIANADNIIIPSTVVDMQGAFANCSRLVTPPDMSNATSVVTMKDAFVNGHKLAYFPDISNCTGLVDMTRAFTGSGSGVEFDMTDYVIPDGVQILDEAFAHNIVVALPTIPESVISMSGTFSNTKVVDASGLVIPDGVKNISYLFDNCSYLEKAPVIPEGIEDMSYMFRYCYKLTDVSAIPSTVKNMKNAFNYCVSLTGTLEINANPTEYDYCFLSTKEMIYLTGTSTKLTALAATDGYADLSENDNVRVMCETHTLGNSVTTASTCTEKGSITSICTSCGEVVVEETPALGHNYTSTITTEPTCSSTGIRTFTCTRCSDTFAEEIPAVTHIDADIDFICDNCGAEPVVPVGGEYYSSGTTYKSGEIMPSTPQTGDQFMLGDYIYMYNQYWSSGTKTDENMNGWSAKAIYTNKETYGEILPDIYGSPIVSLVKAFAQCENMKISPAIPSTVTNLTETYYLCSSLTTAPAIPSDIKYLSRTFVGCTSLNDISNFVIPEGATVLFGVFSGCESLETAPLIPSTVTDIFSIFSKCKSLKTYVGSTDPDGDFSGYIIPYGVTDVSHAFSDCDAMVTAPKIPNSVTVAQFTFRYCDSLTGVVYFNSVREVGAHQTFDDTINDIILVTEYPDATAPSYDTPYGSILSAYQQNDGNVKFGFIFDIVYSGDNSCYITVNETTYTENTRLFIPIGETVTITCNGNNGDCLGSITHNGSTKTTSTLSYSFTSYGNTTITINSSTQDGTPYGTITIDTPVLFDDQISYN